MNELEYGRRNRKEESERGVVGEGCNVTPYGPLG